MNDGHLARAPWAPSNEHHVIAEERRAEANGRTAETSASSEDWLVPLLLVSMLEGNAYSSQLKHRIEELGFSLPRPGLMYRALHAMEREELIISDREEDEVLPSRWRFEPTEAGEAYLEFWVHSLTQYRAEIDRFLSVHGMLEDPGPPHRAFDAFEEAHGR